MARKLTDQERANLETLREAMSRVLEPSLRNKAASVASSLVRVQGDVITDEDIAQLLKRHGKYRDALESAMRSTVLAPVEGCEGVYTLRLDVAADAAEPGAPEADEAGAEVSAEPEIAAEEASGADEDSTGLEGAGEDKGDVAAGESDGDALPQAVEAGPEGQGSAAAEVEHAAEPEPVPEPSDASAPAPANKPSRRRRRTHTRSSAAPTAQPVKDDVSASDEPVADANAAKAVAGDGTPIEKDVDEMPPATAEPFSAGPDLDDRRSDPGDRRSDPGDRRSDLGDSDPDAAPERDTTPDATGTPEPRRTRGRRLRGKPRRSGAGDASNSGKPTQLADVPYVRRGGPSETEVRSRILELDQRFWLNGWLLSHPGAYTLYERELIGINDALVNGALPGDITRRQLAYQMGGDEKFFEYGSDGHKLLRAMGMEDIIRHRPMPKPDLLYHAPRRRKHMRVLVTENLDPWLDVHDLMYEEGRTTILGERIHAVVLGGGTPVLEHNRLALLLDTLGADSLEVLYWGDIDRAGIDIMMRLRDVLGEQYPFKPFFPAYQLMVERAQERYPEPADNEQTGQVNIGMPDMSMLTEGLTEEAAAYARAVVEGCRLVPQEILTRRDL